MTAIFRNLALAATLAALAGPGFAADPALGKAKARQCSVCHGKDGIGKDPEVPNLAGQSAFYLEKALKDFREGARQDRRMSLIAKPLSDEDIANLAAWFASFKITVEVPQ